MAYVHVLQKIVIFLKIKQVFYKKRTFVNILCYSDHRGTILNLLSSYAFATVNNVITREVN